MPGQAHLPTPLQQYAAAVTLAVGTVWARHAPSMHVSKANLWFPEQVSPVVVICRLLEGVSGVEQIDRFDASEFPTKFAAQIKNFSDDG